MESESYEFPFERVKKFFESSYKMVGRVEYFDGGDYLISESLLTQDVSEAIKRAELEIEVLAERDDLFRSKRIIYHVLDSNNMIVHMYDSALKDEHSN